MMFWFLMHIFGAFCWFSAAAGYWKPDPWFVSFAFILLGIGSILNGAKELLKT